MKLDSILAGLPATMSVADVTSITGFPDSTVRASIARGQLRCIRMGRRVRVLTESVLDLIDDEPALLAELRRKFVKGEERGLSA
ncbi:MAG: hypothetical protein KDB80_03685 [Planctomycetes bacterium]|nr:hypothetical protein [Planctomycetota bacterium]